MNTTATPDTKPVAQEIPEGYRMNAQQHLVHESLIKPVDALRDDLVKSLAKRADELHQDLANFKDTAFKETAAFIEEAASQYDVELGGKRGNVTLYSFDGQYKVERQTQDRIGVNESIMAAKKLMDECAEKYAKDAGPEAQAIISHAFKTNKQGELVISRLLELRKLDIKDEDWQKAMQAINDSLHAVGSKSYIRVYQRVGDTDRFEAINLNLSSI